ncbi:MAG: cyanoexosortase B system-associated protein [Plectolyngbya sp. WJT66-NPBG17]|jgi:cyanoexosortase B-associated protein|nr:cyanoexosortase B system-associated protein [Plectolyngbya sp. WJT66-NPBG17]MBW4526300.1 cyanoexosortase B system-associated protein [Phormidium tanganyikae FI6-MK23]
MLTLLAKSRRVKLPKVVLLLILSGLVCLGALPGYVAGGQWRWTAPPKVAALDTLKILKKNGIEIPGWQTIEKQVTPIGEHKWMRQELQDSTQTKATVLFFPQARSIDQPQVEWADLDGSQSWKTDSHRQIQTNSITVEFLRAWTSKQTYAVMRWYAWENGGHPAPIQWFINDRIAQWQNRRAAWVAVSVILPIEPLEDIEPSRSKLEPLVQTVQSTLTNQVLRSN